MGLLVYFYAHFHFRQKPHSSLSRKGVFLNLLTIYPPNEPPMGRGKRINGELMDRNFDGNLTFFRIILN